MPESKKTSLTEIDARLQAGGPESVRLLYGVEPWFLVIPPADQLPPPLVWTPVNGYLSPKTDLLGLGESFQDVRNLSNYAIPVAVACPLLKSGRDSAPYVTLGRASTNDIRLSSVEVSKTHAHLEHSSKGGWTIQDLGSSNGTFVNGNRLESFRKAVIFPNDEVCFGNVRALFLNFSGVINLCGLMKTSKPAENLKIDPCAEIPNSMLSTIKLPRNPKTRIKARIA